MIADYQDVVLETNAKSFEILLPPNATIVGWKTESDPYSDGSPRVFFGVNYEYVSGLRTVPHTFRIIDLPGEFDKNIENFLGHGYVDVDGILTSRGFVYSNNPD